MRNYIIADNQELTAYALQSLLKRDEGSAIFRAVDRSGLTDADSGGAFQPVGVDSHQR